MRVFSRCGAILQSRVFSGCGASLQPLARYFSAQIDASKIAITKTTAPKPKKPLKELTFGTTFTDHMFVVDWVAEKGWGTPTIVPYGPFSVEPCIPAFHYAMECFEGMKAYKDAKGCVRLFRPDMNMSRMYASCERICLPTFDKSQMLECIKKLVLVDKDWVPSEDGYSLYIRPTVIGTAPALGVGPSNQARIFVICSPVGPYYPTGFNPVSILAEDRYQRAWAGGTGDAKVGGNYAPTVLPQRLAYAKGFQQVLWLAGDFVTEVGTMNIFFLIKSRDGVVELVTAPLDGTILPGVTRDSVLALCREWNEFKVSERPITIQEVITAAKEGRLLEAFGAGTAAVVSPVNRLKYKNEEVAVPLDPSNPDSKAGKVALRVWSTLLDIQYGRISHPWSVKIE